MRKFEFKKSYEELEIAGKVYRMRFDDEKLLEYHEAFDEFYQDTKKMQEVETEDMEHEELLDTYKEIREMSKKILDTVLGEGAYDELYEKSGQSTMGMVDVINFVSDAVGDGMEKVRNKKKQNYIKKQG